MIQTTTRKLTTALHAALVEAYTAQLNAFGPSLKKETRECLIDGFKDGAASGIRRALAMVECKISEE